MRSQFIGRHLLSARKHFDEFSTGVVKRPKGYIREVFNFLQSGDIDVSLR